MRRVSVHLSAFAILVVMTLTVGCAKSPSDDQIASDIQSKLSTDSGLQGKQLVVQAAKGTVTLSGTVDTDAQRDAASHHAASEAGVKQVINNLQVSPSGNQAQVAQNAPAQVPAPQPSEEDTKPSPSTKRHHSARRDADSARSNNTGSSQANGNQMASSAPPPAPSPDPAPVAPPPPPPPVKITIPSGAALAVRLVDPIDSDTAQQGQTFHATLNSPLSVDGETAIPSGYDVEGHVATVQSAGKFAGQSMLVLQLDRIKAGDKYYNIQTDQFTRKASSRSKNTAEKVGGGAILGAIIGGIAGGGKGAAIGTAAGAGVGGGVQAAGHSKQVKLDSETVLNFTLQAPVTVTQVTKSPDAGRPKLDSNQ
ncbi:MAG TPA: BON domain-containing protein [Terriglobales bacterium]|nr:BON domain-containing protein [Terriglobales bacterium]